MAQRQVSVNNLDLIVNFCENMMDCRRALQLDYFGEHFTSEQCLMNKASACDNCSRGNQYKETDVTDIARMIASAVKDLSSNRNRNTVLQLVDVFKGSNSKKIVESGYNNTKYHGHLKHWDRSDIQRIFHKLVLENFLQEEIFINQNDIPISYIRIGSKIAELMTPGSRTKVMFAIMDDKQQHKQRIEVAAVDPADDELVDKCYHELVDVAQRIAEERGLTLAQVMNMQAIREMSIKMPESENEMLKISHVTKANFDKYGQRFLNITVPYSAQRAMNAMDNDEMEDDEHDGTNWEAAGRAASTMPVIQRGGGNKRPFAGRFNGYKSSAKKFKASNSRAKKKTPVKKAKATSKNLLPRPKPTF